MENLNIFTNVKLHRLIYSILYLLISPQMQLLFYQLARFKSYWFGIGFFHLLFILYIPSFIVGMVFMVWYIWYYRKNMYKSPFYLPISKLFIIGFLNIVEILTSFMALTIDSTNNIQD